MQNRRDFLKTAAFAAIGSGLSLQGAFAGEKAPVSFAINQLGLGAKMKLRFFPYELKLKHVFTVATYSRTTTPDVQVEIEYDGVIGYGEASMPPYLGQTVDSVMGFLKKVDLEQFDDPFRLEDKLAYVDGLTPGDTAAKAPSTLHCTTWWVNFWEHPGTGSGGWIRRKHLRPPSR